jgi:putative spermidine/putrescine transport system permease protein
MRATKRRYRLRRRADAGLPGSAGPVIRTATVLIALFLLAPSVIVLTSAVTTASIITFPPHGLTFHWFSQLASKSDLRTALLHSLYVGVEGVMVGVTVGVPAALGMHRHNIRLKSLMNAFLALGFSTPLIVSGIAFLVLFTQLNIVSHLSSMGLAVAVCNLPFMIWSLASAASALDPELEAAAATLGASGVERFLFIIVPTLTPGLIVGGLLMFVFGITEFLVSLVLVVPSDMTLPVYLFGSIRGATSPLIAAAGVVYICVAMGAVVWLLRSGELERFLRRSST